MKKPGTNRAFVLLRIHGNFATMETVSEFDKKPFNPEAAVKAYFDPHGYYVTITRLGYFVNIFLQSKESAHHHLKASWDCPAEIFKDPAKLKLDLDDRAVRTMGLKI